MRAITFLSAAATGAALAYFLDPENGRVRRAVARDRCRKTYAQLRQRLRERQGQEAPEDLHAVATVVDVVEPGT